jgi:UDP-GlcNAc3NAcA epimerase
LFSFAVQMYKLLTVIGARPQFIKAAPFSKAVASRSDVKEVLVHTGQHFDENMSDVFFKEMGIPLPDYKLDINSLGHGAMTGRMLEEIEKILSVEKPDCVLVYGDTNSTLAGALAAKKLHIKVAHVEAGLRSFNIKMPEEVNRILTDRISDYLFCPSDAAIENLKKEGFENFDCQVLRTGDIMCDALQFFSSYAPESKSIEKLTGVTNFALCTIHRAENTDNSERLKNIISALNEIHQEIPVVLPVHPRTRKILEKTGIKPDFIMIDPVGYLDMLGLLNNCSFVLTDSGGLQKEAYLKEKYCITMRDETEWVELVHEKVNFVAGADMSLIIKHYNQIKSKPFEGIKGLYGNGNSAHSILEALLA